jgi:uncharacterized protein YxjI
MEKLQQADTLVVQQKKEWGEILTGFETRNKYSIMNGSGEQVYLAGEESSFLVRFLLKSYRPYAVHILSPQGNAVLKLAKPFRFYFHEMDVVDSHGRNLGTVKREFSILNRRFAVVNSTGTELYKIFGPLLHPWTFRVLNRELEVGKIAKKWSGIGKEFFTSADNFNVAFPPGIEVDHKALLLGALFLIDMLHFEKK